MGGSEPPLVLMITDESVATSGHILDTHTGRGAAKLASVTIIAPDAASADALSTAVSVLGQERGLALIETPPNIEAILIPANNPAHAILTAGAKAYVSE